MKKMWGRFCAWQMVSTSVFTPTVVVLIALLMAILVTSCGLMQSGTDQTSGNGTNDVTSGQTESNVTDDEGKTEDGDEIKENVQMDENVQSVTEWSKFPNLQVPEGWEQVAVYDGAEVYEHGTDEGAYTHPDDLNSMHAKFRIYENECLECLQVNYGTSDDPMERFEQGMVGTWYGWDVSCSVSCPECNSDVEGNAERDVYKYWARKTIDGEEHWVAFWRVEYPELTEAEIEWILGQWFSDGKNSDIWEGMQSVSSIVEAYEALESEEVDGKINAGG